MGYGPPLFPQDPSSEEGEGEIKEEKVRVREGGERALPFLCRQPSAVDGCKTSCSH